MVATLAIEGWRSKQTGRERALSDIENHIASLPDIYELSWLGKR
jgi:hypothetical protein